MATLASLGTPGYSEMVKGLNYPEREGWTARKTDCSVIELNYPNTRTNEVQDSDFLRVSRVVTEHANVSLVVLYKTGTLPPGTGRGPRAENPHTCNPMWLLNKRTRCFTIKLFHTRRNSMCFGGQTPSHFISVTSTNTKAINIKVKGHE